MTDAPTTVSPTTSRRHGAPKSPARSRISNGRDLLPGVDGRSLIARRYRDIADAVMADQGGLDHCTEARVQLIRRFAAAACISEQMEARLARGEDIDIAQHAQLCSSLVRLVQRIGINRRVLRDVTTLADILKSGYAEEVHDGDDSTVASQK